MAGGKPVIPSGGATGALLDVVGERAWVVEELRLKWTGRRWPRRNGFAGGVELA